MWVVKSSAKFNNKNIIQSSSPVPLKFLKALIPEQKIGKMRTYMYIHVSFTSAHEYEMSLCMYYYVPFTSANKYEMRLYMYNYVPYISAHKYEMRLHMCNYVLLTSTQKYIYTYTYLHKQS